MTRKVMLRFDQDFFITICQTFKPSVVGFLNNIHTISCEDFWTRSFCLSNKTFVGDPVCFFFLFVFFFTQEGEL